jgi:hypothetical protein
MRWSHVLVLVAAQWVFPALASGEAPEPAPPHPEPRVIVSVHGVQGPHVRKDVERAARLGWGRIVRCYKASSKRPSGSVHMELAVAGSGKVTHARRTKSTLGDAELARCLTRAMKELAMPKARRASTAKVEVRVGPGDD